MPIGNADLILTDGKVYHLQLAPEQIADTIITVGDPDRVGEVSQHFDRIDHRVQHREFATHTGELRGKRISVVSTGIGTDNVDIVVNEIDALFNVDLETREIKDRITALDFIRIGTTGGIQANMIPGVFTVSTMAVGLDSLMHFYDFEQNSREFSLSTGLADYAEARNEDLLLMPYAAICSDALLIRFDRETFKHGISVTTPGFYAPQGRRVRARPMEPKFLQILQQFSADGKKLTNIEMETAGLYGLSRLLGHRAISCSVVLANRLDNTFSADPAADVRRLITAVLEKAV